MANRKTSRPQTPGPLTPPKVWPFPTWMGQPYKPPKQRKKKLDTRDLPDALF